MPSAAPSYRKRTMARDGYYSSVIQNVSGANQEEEIEYQRNKIFLGWTQLDEPYYIANRKEDVILLVAPRGAGKSFLLRSHMGRAYLGGCKCFMPIDTKAEYRTNNYADGIQSSLQKLMPGEYPQPIPTKMFMPAFLKQFYPSGVPAYNETFEFGFRDMSERAWCTLLNVDPDNDTEFPIIQDIAEQIQEGQINGWDGIIDFIDSDSVDAHPATKRKIRNKIKSAQKRRVLGDEYRDNPIDHLYRYDDNGKEKQGYVVVQNLMKSGNLPENAIEHQLYTGMMMEDIVNKLRDGTMTGPVITYIDEAHRIVPRNENTISKKMTIDYISQYRDLGVRVVLATQFPSQLPEQGVLNQVNKFIMPKKIDSADRKWILDKTDVFSFGDYQRDTWKDIFSEMGPYDVMVVNKNPRGDEKRWEIVTPASPLSRHKT